eukprot:Sspe_Gene.5614::Locus_1857_Transcript_1_1_Confidence_1.000_Length_2771::g.5614::m.5614
MLTTQSIADGRRRLVLVLLGGEVGDEDRLSGVRGKLASAGVEVMGVVVRRFGSHDAAALGAERSLKPLTSPPQETHFASMKLEALKEQVFDVLCNPGTQWGSWLVKETKDQPLPCAFHRTSTRCNRDAGCQWSEERAECVDSPCLQFCDRAGCEGAAGSLLCRYNETEHMCEKKRVCAAESSTECVKEVECRWKSGECEEKPCLHTARDSCVSDDHGCEWIGGRDGVCKERRCNYKVREECTGDKTCQWTTDGTLERCMPLPCKVMEMLRDRADALPLTGE